MIKTLKVGRTYFLPNKKERKMFPREWSFLDGYFKIEEVIPLESNYIKDILIITVNGKDFIVNNIMPFLEEKIEVIQEQFDV